MKTVVFHSDANAEANAATAYYERKRPGLGLELGAELERVVDLVQRNPQIGTTHKAPAFRYSVLKRFPFVVYYEEFDEFLWIVAVAHGRRRQGYWKRRRPE